jgi:hypothetical protein
MLPNDCYIGEDGAEPQFVYNCIHIMCGDLTPDKSSLLNISICALNKKWKYKKKKGAKNEADKAYEPSYVAQTIRTLFAWFLDNDIWYKCALFTESGLQHFVSCFFNLCTYILITYPTALLFRITIYRRRVSCGSQGTLEEGMNDIPTNMAPARTTPVWIWRHQTRWRTVLACTPIYEPTIVHIQMIVVFG